MNKLCIVKIICYKTVILNYVPLEIDFHHSFTLISVNECWALTKCLIMITFLGDRGKDVIHVWNIVLVVLIRTLYSIILTMLSPTAPTSLRESMLSRWFCSGSVSLWPPWSLRCWTLEQDQIIRWRSHVLCTLSQWTLSDVHKQHIKINHILKQCFFFVLLVFCYISKLISVSLLLNLLTL